MEGEGILNKTAREKSAQASVFKACAHSIEQQQNSNS